MFRWHFYFRCGEILFSSSLSAPWLGVVTEQLASCLHISMLKCLGMCSTSWASISCRAYPYSGQTASDILQLEGSPWSQKWLLCTSGETSSLVRKWWSVITALAQSTPFFLMPIHSTRRFIYSLTGLVLIWISSHLPHQKSLVTCPLQLVLGYMVPVALIE